MFKITVQIINIYIYIHIFFLECNINILEIFYNIYIPTSRNFKNMIFLLKYNKYF